MTKARGEWDGLRLRQVLYNLVINALRYGQDDTPVQVALTGDHSLVLLEVKNQGLPIGPATFDLMFDPLRRGEPDGSDPQGEGLGLGLYISREIARAHGGSIDASSDKSGTIFKVSLPRWHLGLSDHCDSWALLPQAFKTESDVEGVSASHPS